MGSRSTPPSIVTTADNVLAIPYLGPLPQPSRSLSRVVQAGAVVLALLALARAVAYWRLAAVEQRVVLGESGRSLAAALRDATNLVSAFHTIVMVTTFAFFVVLVAWNWSRRPKARRNAQGEAYVESPVSAILPLWFRLLTSAFWLAGFWTFFVTQPKQPAASDLASYRMGLMASSVAWAIGALAYILWVEWLNSAFEIRVAASTRDRERPDSVPFHTPISERKAAGDIGTPEGAGWVVRMFVLVIAGFMALIGVLALGAAIFDPKARTLEGMAFAAAFLVGGVGLFVLMLRAHRAARSTTGRE